jgi:hypothetical protein
MMMTDMRFHAWRIGRRDRLAGRRRQLNLPISTRRMTLVARAAVGVLIVVSAVACGRSAATDQPPPAQPSAADNVTVPAKLAVPTGQRVVATLKVDHGAQVYACARGAWTLKEPAAVLTSGTEEVLHTAGPSWISTTDGSAVTGAPSAMVAVPGAVPELLLRATAHRGNGLFGPVDYIQRLATQGGVAPAGACADGTQQAVPYTAQYRFYAPA